MPVKDDTSFEAQYPELPKNDTLTSGTREGLHHLSTAVFLESLPASSNLFPREETIFFHVLLTSLLCFHSLGVLLILARCEPRQQFFQRLKRISSLIVFNCLQNTRLNMEIIDYSKAIYFSIWLFKTSPWILIAVKTLLSFLPSYPWAGALNGLMVPEPRSCTEMNQSYAVVLTFYLQHCGPSARKE